jgi:hypothetical protein
LSRRLRFLFLSRILWFLSRGMSCLWRISCLLVVVFDLTSVEVINQTVSFPSLHIQQKVLIIFRPTVANWFYSAPVIVSRGSSLSSLGISWETDDHFQLRGAILSEKSMSIRQSTRDIR